MAREKQQNDDLLILLASEYKCYLIVSVCARIFVFPASLLHGFNGSFASRWTHDEVYGAAARPLAYVIRMLEWQQRGTPD